MVTTTTNNNNHTNNDDFEIDQDDGMQDLGLPVSVQTFLWRQIAPFIRPKLGKLHEASCMVSFSLRPILIFSLTLIFYAVSILR